MEKTIEVRDIVNSFGLEILTCEGELDRRVSKKTSRRPGLEFMGYLDYLPMGHVQVLGKNEIRFLHSVEKEERLERIGSLVVYDPPCFIVTDDQTGLEILTKFCTERGIPLLRAKESNYEFIGKLDAYLIKRLAPEIAVHGVCVNVSGLGVLIRGDS